MIILFILSMIGYVHIVYRKLQIKREFVPLVVLCLIALSTFIGGLINQLLWMTHIIMFIGFICFIIFIREIIKSIQNWHFPSLPSFCFLLGSVAFLGFSFFLRFDHFDNFSHWGIAVKQMLIDHHFPTLQSSLIAFKDYPLGMSSLIYYFCIFLGRTQGIMIFCQNAMIFSCFYAMSGIIKEKRRFLLYSVFALGCSLMIYVNVTIRIHNLLVDFLLPLMTLASFSISYVYQTSYKKSILPLFLVLSMITITKNIGIFFMIIGYIYWEWLFLKNKSVKYWQHLGMSFLMLSLTLLPIFLWKCHLHFSFADYEDKFALFSQNVPSSQYPYICLLFFKNLFLLEHYSTQTLLILEITAIILCLWAKFILHKKWNLGKVWICLNIIVICYEIGLLCLYLFAMPANEALYLAGYERYHCSIIILFCGGITMGLVKDIEKSFYIKLGDGDNYKAFYSPQTKQAYQYLTFVTTLLAIFFIYSEFGELISIHQRYSQSLAGRMNQLVGDSWNTVPANKQKRYLLVSSQQEHIDNYEIHYIAKYFLYSDQVDVISLSDWNENFKNYDQIFILDDEKNFE